MRHVSYGGMGAKRESGRLHVRLRRDDLLPADAEERPDRTPVCVPAPSRPRFSRPDL